MNEKTIKKLKQKVEAKNYHNLGWIMVEEGIHIRKLAKELKGLISKKRTSEEDERLNKILREFEQWGDESGRSRNFLSEDSTNMFREIVARNEVFEKD